MQVLGGHGFMADYPVEKHMREARALGLLCGGFDSAIEEAGQLLTASTSPLVLASPCSARDAAHAPPSSSSGANAVVRSTCTTASYSSASALRW